MRTLLRCYVTFRTYDFSATIRARNKTVLIERDSRLRTGHDSCTISIITRDFKESRALIIKLVSEYEVNNFQARATVRVAAQKPSEAQVPPALATYVLRNIRAILNTRPKVDI